MTTEPLGYEADYHAEHATRPGFRITELRLSGRQKVPWHRHTHVQDTFYVLEGTLRIFLRDPDDTVLLEPGGTFTVAPGRPHLVTHAGDAAVGFLVLQGLGEYDFVPLVRARSGPA